MGFPRWAQPRLGSRRRAAHTAFRTASGLRVSVNKAAHRSNITIGLQLKMTSGTNILSASEKLKLPVVAGASAALSKFSSRVALSCGETQVWVSSFPSPCHYPGATAHRQVGWRPWQPRGDPRTVFLSPETTSTVQVPMVSQWQHFLWREGNSRHMVSCPGPPCANHGTQSKLFGCFLPQCPCLRWE